MTHCSRHDVPLLPGGSCVECADEATTLVCAWRHTHEGEKWISGPPIGSGAATSHGICEPCLAVEQAAWIAEAGEMRAARERAKEAGHASPS